MKCLLGLRVLLIREQERKTSSYGSSFLFKPHVCQFWNTTTLFRPVKVHEKSAFTREKIQHWILKMKVNWGGKIDLEMETM